MCGEEDRFRGNKIKIAPLQISKESRNFEAMQKMGHYHHRKDIVKVYSETVQENILPKQLFIESQRHAEETSRNNSTDEAKENHILRYGNLVFIAGQAGIGKTTFTKLLVKQMLDPAIHLFDSKYIFFLRFRDVDYEERTDLLLFLTASAKFVADMPSEQRKMILRELQNCDSVYIVMDGLDEAIIDLKAQEPNCNAFSVTTAAIFIKNLLTGNIFSRAKKLVTSRPRQLARLLSDGNKSNFMVNILGLNDDGQKQICGDIVGVSKNSEEEDGVNHDRKEKNNRRDKILEYIHSRPDLKSYCYVPINCILIMISFSVMDSSQWSNVDSLSAVLITALEEWFLKKMKSEFQTKEISNMAYEGFLSDRYHFREFHLKMAKINFENTTTFLTNNIRFKLLKGDKVSYFCHLIWQEFFVAIKLRLYTCKENFEKIVSELDSDKYEVVTKFLFGLCNENKFYELLDLVEIEGLNSNEDREECKQILKKIAIERLHKLLEDDVEDYMTSILPVLGWVYEMKDEDLTHQTSKLLREKIMISNQVLPCDIPSFNYVLQCRKLN